MAVLGRLLRQRGAISKLQLSQALQTQNHSGGRLGDILLAQGALNYLSLYQSIAQQEQCSFVKLTEDPPDAMLPQACYLHDYLRLRFLPWKKLASGVVVVATSEPASLALHAWLKEHYGKNWRCVVTSPLDIRMQIERLFSSRLTTESRAMLYVQFPHRSARRTLQWRQKLSLVFMIIAAAMAVYHHPRQMAVCMVMVFHVLYASAMLLKGTVFQVGRMAAKHRKSVPPVQTLCDKDLPVYTLLVPLYREAESLPALLASLARLHYPVAKLDIKLIIEADDDETFRAAQALRPGYHVDIIRVPVSKPRTKPKACNYGLRFARGDYLTIYDAEDRPHPDQLRASVAAFRAAPKDVVCLQARLRYFNADENMLTRLFELEYRILFRTLLPGLQALGIPLPLGGTSNHFNLKRLRALGAWDPYNVTEDADIGVRISVAGLRTQMLDSFTLEEAPITLSAWFNQRSRWIKGYMQTWCVHMRSPVKLLQEIGLTSFMGLQFFIGISCLAFLTAPIIWALSLWLLYSHGPGVPQWFGWVMWLNLCMFLVLHWQQAASVLPLKRGKRWRFIRAAIIFPVYWFLHSLASYKALWQLIFRPHYWEKTRHGLSKYVRLAGGTGKARKATV